MRVRALAAAAAAAVAVVPIGAVAAQADTAETTDVTIVHGLDGLVVDIFVDGVLAADDFSYTNIVIAELEPGDYNVQVKASTASDAADPAAEPAILETDASVGADPFTVVAQLDEAGAPTLGVYADDFSEPAAGEGRVTVRHAAAAPEVDILVEGTSVGTVANGEQLSADLPAGTYDVEVQAGGATVEPLTPGDVELPAGSSVIAYAVGSLDGETLDLIVDVIPLTDDAEPTPTDTPSATDEPTTAPIPTAVPAGDGTSSWAGPLALPALIALTLAGVLALAVGLAVRKSGSRA
ncbi:MAG: DUF4397 domain-containing protein [Kineosporiaceae bacterium]